MKLHKSQKGFTLSVALIMTTIILAVSFSISTIISKSVKISGLATEGAAAYFAAESGAGCVIGLEDAALSKQRKAGTPEIGFFRSPTDHYSYVDSNGTNQSIDFATGDTTSVDSSRDIRAFSCGGGILSLVSFNPNTVNISSKSYRLTKIKVNPTAGICSEIEVYKNSDNAVVIVSRGYSKCDSQGAIARELRVIID